MRTEIVATLFVVALFITSAFMVYGGDQGSPSLEATRSNGTVNVNYSLPSSSHSYPSTIVAITVDNHRSDDIKVLLTERSGPPNSDPANVQGLVDHLGAELENIGSSSKVSTIEEGSLGSYLSAGNGTLVIASTVNSTTSLMLEDWVRKGGVLVVIGPDCLPFIGYGGSLEIGFERYTYDDTTAEGTLADTLGLRTVYPAYGISVEDVTSRSGTVLGFTSGDGSVTTMATVPLGLGRVLAMGGPIESPFLASMEDVYAWDLARCLETGAQWAAGPIYHERMIVPAQGLVGSLAFGIDKMAIRISVFSLDDSHALFKSVMVAP